MEYSIRHHRNHFNQSGYLLLEALIAMAIFVVLIVMLVSSFQHVFASQQTSWERVEAGLYAQEAMEVSYNLAVSMDWDDFRTSYLAGIFHPEYTPVLQLVAGEEPLGGVFTRRVEVEAVWRDSVTHAVVAEDYPGAMEDEEMLRVIATVNWVVKEIPQQARYETYVTKGVE